MPTLLDVRLHNANVVPNRCVTRTWAPGRIAQKTRGIAAVGIQIEPPDKQGFFVRGSLLVVRRGQLAVCGTGRGNVRTPDSGGKSLIPVSGVGSVGTRVRERRDADLQPRMGLVQHHVDFLKLAGIAEDAGDNCSRPIPPKRLNRPLRSTPPIVRRRARSSGRSRCRAGLFQPPSGYSRCPAIGCGTGPGQRTGPASPNRHP